MMFLVCGGAGSGKSEFAENLSLELFSSLFCKRKIYVATMLNRDKETEKKINLHRQKRNGKGFLTFEQPFSVSSLCSKINKDDVVLLECLSNLLANEMYERKTKTASSPSDRIFKELKDIENACKALVIVTNDVFRSGFSFDDYTKELGRLDCLLGQSSFETFEVSFGIAERQKINLL